MSKSKKAPVKTNKGFKNYIFIGVLLLAVLVGYRMMLPQKQGAQPVTEQNPGQTAQTAAGPDLKLTKADITEKAVFYPYKDAGRYMEVVAVKATDGTIRTALNTCQVCYDSGKGYYEQVGNTLVCQNCGNVFGIDDIEVVKGGCNPVPILKENKTEDDQFITISGQFLADNQSYFERWKK